MSKIRKAFSNALSPTLIKRFREYRQHFWPIFYIGNQYSCNVCNKSFRRFLDAGVRSEVFNRHEFVGSGRREQVKCPSCGSVERVRLLYSYLSDTSKSTYPGRGGKVLHFAPEKQIEKFFRESTCDYTTADLLSDQVDMKIDVTDIPFADKTFDLVICNHVLEHVPDDRKAVSEIARVLKVGGTCLLQVPFAADMPDTFEDSSIQSEEQREETFGQFDHVRIYGRDHLDRFGASGLKISTWLPDKETIRKLRLNPKEILNIGTS